MNELNFYEFLSFFGILWAFPDFLGFSDILMNPKIDKILARKLKFLRKFSYLRKKIIMKNSELTLNFQKIPKTGILKIDGGSLKRRRLEVSQAWLYLPIWED